MDFQPDPRAAESLVRLEVAPFRGVVWKHTLPGQSPSAANTKGARWNPPGVPAIYVAVDKETALAEGRYLASAQPQPVRGERQVHEAEVDLAKVVDLRDRATLRDLGISDVELRSSDYEPCRKVGGTAEWLGFDGMIVPSARSEGANLVIFERRAPDFALRVTKSAKLMDA